MSKPFTRLFAAAFVLCCLCLSVQARSTGGPNIADKPPLLRVTTLLQAPPGAKFDADALRGRVVVLEFWATWCGPCVGAIKHLNELADKFAGQPVCFVSITAEKADVIASFLKKRPMKSWVGLDEDKAMNKAYGIVAIPHTVLIGKDGLIAGITHPQGLSEQHIQDLLEGKPIALKEPSGEDQIAAGIDPDEKNLAEPWFEVLVRPSTAVEMSSVGGGGRFTARGCRIQDLLPRAFNVSAERIMTPDPLPKDRFDFIVAQRPVAGEDHNDIEERVSGLLQQALKSAFGLVGRRETQETEVLLLKVKETNAPGLVVAPTPLGSASLGAGQLDGSLFTVIQALQRALKKPVFDETELTNDYEVSLKWKQESPETPNPEGLTKVVREQLGLELVPAKRPVEVVIVEKIKTKAKQKEAQAATLSHP